MLFLSRVMSRDMSRVMSRVMLYDVCGQPQWVVDFGPHWPVCTV